MFESVYPPALIVWALWTMCMCVYLYSVYLNIDNCISVSCQYRQVINLT